MADSDFNTIKPVDSLQSIQGLTPAERRQERKNRQKPQGKHHEKPEEEQDSSKEQETSGDGQAHSIDYCA